MKTYKELRKLDFDRAECVEIMQGMKDGENDFTVSVGRAEFRFINDAAINQIMKDELTSDLYCLGACTPWFIADITGLDTDQIEKAQKSESFELLGALMEREIDKVQPAMVSADGYGHHFASYDGNEAEIGTYHMFRTN
jgi:hypothetical protein